MTQENPEPMSKDGRWPPALLRAATGAIVIRDFEREGQMAATGVIVRELAAPIPERARYRMHCFRALQEQFGMSRTPFGDRREH
jgi:hypothetical protein